MTHFTEVLIVEDCPMTIIYLTDFFVKAGYDIQAVKTGASAISLFGRNPKQFGLVILDLELPDMLGTQVAQCIRQIEIIDGISEILIPLVISSANLTESVKLAALQSGIQGFFNKPVSEKNKKAMLYMLELKSLARKSIIVHPVG